MMQAKYKNSPSETEIMVVVVVVVRGGWCRGVGCRGQTPRTAPKLAGAGAFTSLSIIIFNIYF